MRPCLVCSYARVGVVGEERLALDFLQSSSILPCGGLFPEADSFQLEMEHTLGLCIAC